MASFNVGFGTILDEAIESILNQDLGDFELLICDDASTDGTYERLLDWAQRDARIRVFRHEHNCKAAAARNRCLSEARGEYIAIMDADDLCSPNRLRAQIDFLSNNPQFSFVGLRGERFCHTLGDTDAPYWFVRFPQKEHFLMTLPFVHGSLLFRKEALLAVGGYREGKKVERSEDYDLLLRLYAAGNVGANISNAVYHIREDQNALRRRKYRYRWKEARVKWNGFSQLGLMPKGIVYALKPLIVGLIPQRFLTGLKNRYYSKKGE
jgi:glycosyltransferase involved in cell wall biosynthesis